MNTTEETYTYPLVSGIACQYCRAPVLVDVGLRSRAPYGTRKGWIKRRRAYLCPACLRTSVNPIRTGKKEVISQVEILYKEGKDVKN